MSHPYSDLPSQAYWRSGVVKADRPAWPGLFTPRFAITLHTRVATAGSCFAQHIGRALRGAGVHVLDAEPAPAAMSEALAHRFSFGVYSGRYGNIYTPRQLVELLEDARSGHVNPDLVWQRDGRFWDALRPGVEPDGLDSADEALALRRDHLTRVLGMLGDADVFIFTLGLTESWRDLVAERTLAIAPGVIAGEFDPARHAFHNFAYPEILADLDAARTLLKALNPEMKMLLTVSPVPLTATATGAHVLAATAQSKAILRAAAGAFAELHADVDYFPSYEIVTTPAAPQPMFAPNLRSVRPEAVAQVMQVFLSAHGMQAPDHAAPAPAQSVTETETDAEDDLICEERLLDAFSK